MLLQIREFLRRETIASNQQIARFFQVDLNALEPMLAIWLRKGVFIYAQEEAKTSCNSGCASLLCRTQSIVYYRYVGG